jgi:hypothetical protein
MRYPARELLVAVLATAVLAFASTASPSSTEDARAVVEGYWASSSSSFEGAYSSLSDAYKRRLRDAFGIRNAQDFAKATGIPERIWRGQTYQRIAIVRPGVAQVIVLAQWEQEGYEGVTTFIFDLVREKGSWRIENIMH